MKKIIVFELLLLFSSVVCIHSQESESQRIIKVGYFENEIFQEGADPSKEKKGYAYEYYQKLSEYTGWKYEYVYGNFEEIYRKAEAGEVDLIAGLVYSRERSRFFGYPSLPMGYETYSIIKKTYRSDITVNAESLKGKKIGVLKSNMESALNNWKQENGVEAQTVVFTDFDPLYNAFDSDAVDAILVSSSGFYRRKEAEIVNTVGVIDYYLCTSLKKQDLLVELNDAQAQLMIDKPDYINFLFSKYYPKTFSSRAFSAIESEWVNSHKVMRVGYMENYLPYSATDKNGNVDGLLKEIFPMMISNLGIRKHMDVQYKGFREYSSMMNALNRGEVDVVFPAGGGLYHSEIDELYLSTPLITSAINLVYKNSYQDFSNKVFSANKNNMMQIYFIQSNFPDARFKYYSSIDEALDAVNKNEADCTIVNGLRTNALLRNSKYKNLQFRGLPNADDRCFGVGFGNRGLLKLINRGVNSVDEYQATNIAYKYTARLYNYTFADFILENIGFIVLLIISIATFVVLRLVNENKKRRRNLQLQELKNEELQNLYEKQEFQLQKIRGLNHELEDARAQAELASDAKSSFLFNMSHDIRTPMNAIMGFTELMEKEINNPEVLQGYLKKIKVSNDYLLSLINNVLDMARIDSGKVKLENAFYDFLQDGDNFFAIFEDEIKRKKIKFIPEVNITHRYVMCDILKTKQILLNVVSNAIKYTPEGGTIHSSTIEVPSEKEGFANYVCTVTDNGIGMSKEFLDHIFDEFTREKTTTESKVSGTGLGMAIVKKLIDIIGGSIEVKSELGKGSTFKITIPYEIVKNPEEYLKQNVKEESEIKAEKKTVDFGGKRILLAEDNDLNAEIAITVLEEYGIQVDRAEDGNKCIEMLKYTAAGFYSLILMDIQMPNKNGYDAAKEIRSMEDKVKAEIPIVAMTANAFEEDKNTALNAGMNGHISKPINVEKLIEKISELL